jgi:N-acetylneuraminic acid mutarotase
MVRISFLFAACIPLVPEEWHRLPPIPDREGVAGAFAGVSGDALIVAGGANFPDRKPWDGGTKHWHDAVYVLDRPDGTWTTAGKLPRPLAYGVSVTHRGSVVCVGGSDATRHYPDSFRLEWAGGRLNTHPLPPLTRTVANACGALVGETLYVAGGQEKPDDPTALRTLFALNLAAESPAWVELPAWPGEGRILAVAVAFDGAFWVVGGCSLAPGGNDPPKRTYLRDAYRYDPRSGWTRVADLPHAVTAAPNPAPTDAGGFYILGGDDGSKVGFTPPDRHPGFMKGILRYDRGTGKWLPAGEWPTPRVTAPVVRWRDRWVIPSGEARPGVRSPEVWSFAPGRGDGR